jgi:hypothetical protein
MPNYAQIVLPPQTIKHRYQIITVNIEYMSSANNLNHKLQKDADALLENLNLVKILSEFGRAEIGGSYIYGTMVDEDIDIVVIVKSEDFSYELRQLIMDVLLKLNNLDGIAMTDRYHHQKMGAPKGFWFGPLIIFNQSKWNIDIWFVTENEKLSHHNSSLHKRMLNISEKQRQTILQIKYDALKSNLKEKGKTSSEIYYAVLDEGATNLNDFLEYKKTKN